MRTKSRAAEIARVAESVWGEFVLCAIFTLLMMRNRIFPLDALLFTNGIEGQDCGQMVWNLWHVNEALKGGHNPYYTDAVYYPVGANLAHHSLAAGYFPLTFLVEKLSGNSALYPFYAYRIIIWLAFTLILYGSYFVLRELGATRSASAIGAVGYAFCSFYITNALHLNHLAGFFIPLAALSLIRVYKNPCWTNFILSALLMSAPIYFTEFTLYIYISALLALACMSLFAQERQALGEKIRAIGLTKLMMAAFIFTLIVAPFAFNFFQDKVIKPKPEEHSIFSANLTGLFVPDSSRTPLYGQLFAPISSRITIGINGSEAFVGFPLLICALIGLWKGGRITLVAGIAALLFFVLSLGPTLKIFSVDTKFPLPYALLMRAPLFDAGRTPVRFIVVAMFFLMIVAAIGISWIEKALRERMNKSLATTAMLLLFAWASAEAYAPAPRQQSFIVPRAQFAQLINGPVLNLPLRINDGDAMMWQIFHHQPIATGYLARYNAEQRELFENLHRIYDKGGRQFCERLSELGIRNILIAPDAIATDLIPLEVSTCPLKVIDLRNDKRSARPENFPLYVAGTRIDFTKREADKYLWYGWSDAEPAYRWSNRGKAAIIFALDKVEECRLRIKLSPFIAPGKIEEQRVAIMLNGQRLATLTLQKAELETYEIVLPARLLQAQNVLEFELPDADTPKALHLSEDARLLGVNAQWMEIAPQNNGH